MATRVVRRRPFIDAFRLFGPDLGDYYLLFAGNCSTSELSGAD